MSKRVGCAPGVGSKCPDEMINSPAKNRTREIMLEVIMNAGLAASDTIAILDTPSLKTTKLIISKLDGRFKKLFIIEVDDERFKMIRTRVAKMSSVTQIIPVNREAITWLKETPERIDFTWFDFMTAQFHEYASVIHRLTEMKAFGLTLAGRIRLPGRKKESVFSRTTKLEKSMRSVDKFLVANYGYKSKRQTKSEPPRAKNRSSRATRARFGLPEKEIKPDGYCMGMQFLAFSKFESPCIHNIMEIGPSAKPGFTKIRSFGCPRSKKDEMILVPGTPEFWQGIKERYS